MNKHSTAFHLTWIVCIICCLLIIFFEDSLPFLQSYGKIISAVLLGVVFFSWGVAMLYERKTPRTDGDILAGLENEDGIVIQIDLPLKELLEKDTVTFKVVREDRHGN